jgi:NitT/TauT family transport system permease protein
LAPILVVSLGANEAPRILITFLVAFFPVVIATTAGLLATPAELLELARSLKASKMQRLLQVQLPYAVPYMFSGLKVAATLAVVGTVVAEFVAAESGLGYLLLSATAFFNTPLAFGSMLLLSFIAVMAFGLVVLCQHYFFSWSVGRHDDIR